MQSEIKQKPTQVQQGVRNPRVQLLQRMQGFITPYSLYCDCSKVQSRSNINPTKMSFGSMAVCAIIILMSCLVASVESNFIYFSMTKSLYIPGEKWSSINITHDINSLTPYVYDIDATFSLSQATQLSQTNSVFDFLKTTGGQEEYMEFNNCYETAVTYMNSLYGQYQPCEESPWWSRKCTMPGNQKFLRSNGLVEQLGNDTSLKSFESYIIDNTFYPCTEGVYQPQLYLFEQINVSIESNALFFTLLEIGCVVLLQILIMIIAFILIMFNKLHRKKSKLLKLKQEKDNKDVLKQFLQVKKHN